MLYSLHHVLRLCRRQCILQKKRFTHIQPTNGLRKDNQQIATSNPGKDFQTLLLKYQDKITFNSYLEHEKLEIGYFKYYIKTLKKAKSIQKKQLTDKSLPPLPTFLQFYVNKERLRNDESPSDKVEAGEQIFQLPFAQTTKIETNNQQEATHSAQNVTLSSEDPEFDRSDLHKWMVNYEYFDDSQINEDDELGHWSKNYGTPDPTVGISRVPCGGCGALLHCSDPAIPGYLPSEIFRDRTDQQLKTMECQRCHFLREYNIALDVTVQPEEYENLLQSIRYVKSLVVLMVDLLDFPCSIWPGIVDIIGTDRPIIIVGNKVDLLPGDSHGYLKRVRKSLVTEIKKTKLGEANIKHISLISAKTGFGVEDLISVMFKEWLYKGDVFLVGSTNVGKSSLFNALLQSDYCKVHAVDIVKRATVSRWPGTTLNLLKFPINRPSGWKIYERTKRLKNEAKSVKMENEIRKAQSQDRPQAEAPLLIGHIGRSFSTEYSNTSVDIAEKRRKMLVLDEKNEIFAKSKWFYDTPGVILPDQALSLLSTEELLLTIPKKVIRPQTYYLTEGSTLFIGGLARIDVVECSHPCRLTIFCSERLPITVTATEDADEVYEQFLGTELFAVPTGGAPRLSRWPGLRRAAELLQFAGQGARACCGDAVLPPAAWAAVTAKRGAVCRLAAWAPRPGAIRRRLPSVLPYAVNLKGKRLRDTPAYMIGKAFCENQ